MQGLLGVNEKTLVFDFWFLLNRKQRRNLYSSSIYGMLLRPKRIFCDKFYLKKENK